MTGVFEVTAHHMDDEAERVGGNRARVAATETAKSSYTGYLASAETADEFEARLAYIEPDLRMMVTAACAEHGYDNPAQILEEVTATLREKSAWNFDKKDDDDEGDDEGDKDEDDKKESSTKVADGARPETGDTYVQERVDVATGPDASPEIDKSKVPASGLDAIDVPSKDHPRELQSVKDKPDFGDGTGPADPTEHPRKTVDIAEPIGEEGAVGDGGTFTGGPDSAVTSSSESKWTVLDGE